jgi:hypothetical protein
MSAEAPPATGIELFHVDAPLAASQEPDNFTSELRRVRHAALKEAP